jgi:aminoglycoside 3-N-acetyltransferase
VGQGSVLFVHSALDQMRTIRATPTELIKILREAVGETGTIAMPSFPMSGLSQVYLEGHTSFDARRTPSQSGLLTELLRRMPDAERSLHPTHPVVAVGHLAKALTADHHLSSTPFDEHSPFHKLVEADALVLRLGRFDAMTLRHLADHYFQDSIPYPIYASRSVECVLTAKDGSHVRMTSRGHNPDLTCDYPGVLERMASEGRMATATAGGVPITSVRARAYIEAYERSLRAGLLRHRPRSDHPPRGPTAQ